MLNDLLSENSNLLNELLSNNSDLLGLSDNSDLSDSLSNNLLDVNNLLLDDCDLSSDSSDLLDDSSSFGLWGLEKSNNQLSDGLLIDSNLLNELENLGDLLNNNLLLCSDNSEVFWFV